MPSRSVLTNVGHAVRSARTNPLPSSSTIASDRSTLSIGTLRGRSGRCLARACWGYPYFVPAGHLAPSPALASQLWGAPLVPSTPMTVDAGVPRPYTRPALPGLVVAIGLPGGSGPAHPSARPGEEP